MMYIRQSAIILMMAVCIVSCEKTESSLETSDSILKATSIIESQNMSKLSQIQKNVDNHGRRADDVALLDELFEYVMHSSTKSPNGTDDFLALLKELVADVTGLGNSSSRLKYFSDKFNELNLEPTIDEEGNPNEAAELLAYWELNMAMTKGIIIDFYSSKFGASDLSFAPCCGVNVTSNIQTTPVGKEVSVVLTNPSDVQMAYSDLEVSSTEGTIESQVTLMDDVAIVKFMLPENKDISISFDSKIDMYDSSFVEKKVVRLGDN